MSVTSYTRAKIDELLLALSTTLSGKADSAALIDGLAGKVNSSTFTAGLAAKADAEATATALASKADAAATSSALAGKASTASLATVATTGAYADLTGKPTIPPAFTAEEAQDAAAALLAAGTHTNVVVTHDDVANALSLSVAAGGTALTLSATQTAPYVAKVGEIAMMNVPSGATTLTLPSNPANRAQVGFRSLGATTAVPLTIVRGGTDTIGDGGATSVVEPLSGVTRVYQFDSPSKRWLPVSDVKPLTALDGRYGDAAVAGLVGAPATATGVALRAAFGPVLTGYDLLIVAGQSNATKRSTLPAVVADEDSRIFEWDPVAAQIGVVPAGDTSWGNTQWLGNEFAREYVRRTPGRKVLIVPCAEGSTGFATTSLASPPAGYTSTGDPAKGTWDRTLTADLVNHYMQMITRAQAALAAAGAGARIVAVLWSQGESDRGLLTQATYAAKLDDLIAQTRSALALPTLPFIVGSLTPETVLDNAAGTAEIDAALSATPRRVERTAYVAGPADMIEHANSRLHWSPQGQSVRGREMAAAGLYRARLNFTGGAPVQPQNLTARRTSAHTIEATWTHPPCRVINFTVEYSTDGGTTWITAPMLGDAASTRTSFYADSLALVLVRARTGNSVGTTDPTRPVLVPPLAGGAALHAPGVTGFSHRYVGRALPADLGMEVTAWQDIVGTAHMAAYGAAPVRSAPKVRGTAATRYLEFDGVNDTIKTDSMGSTVGTVVMVARARTADTSTTILASGTGVSVNRASTTGTAINPGTLATNSVKLDNQWRFVAAIATATEASLSIDGTKVTATAAGGWGTAFRLAANGTPNFYAPLDIAEVITYPTALADADVATVRAALQAAYPGMLL